MSLNDREGGKRFENNLPIRDLSFTWTAMWVQIHDIPFRYLNRRVAEEICEVVGVVDRTTSTDEMEGGNFMRVRVSVDISLPLCRGRVLSLDEGSEVWVSFKYERLPNICYWCGCLTHSDRDCEVWINSDGSLKAGDQEYGPWLRASFTPNRRQSMVVVPGFYEARKKNFVGKSRATTVDTDQIARPVDSVPLVSVQVQPLDVTDSRLGLQTHSDSLIRDDSQLGEGGESAHESRGLAEVQVPCVNLVPPTVQGEFLEKQIEEIDRGLSCFDTKNVVSGDVSDSGSLSGGDKVSGMRRRRVVRTVSDLVISNESGKAPVKRSSKEFQSARHCPSKKASAQQPRWKPPDSGFVKANFDGAIFEDLSAAGIGVAVRNEHGEVVATLAEKIPIPNSIFTLETLAARRAVLFVQELGLRNVVFEGDSESSIQAISNRLLSHSSCGHLIHDILLFASSFLSFSFSHVCRQGNALADALAKRARLSCPLLVWKNYVPPDLYNCYLSDFPLSI
ncbi:hypothetical protein SO802_013922 [Lithocarpus litseifolius]|uniref:RNase H type-1 domain-containing protein n=1 Tax=Lithocarpus litseifolius TaxID=425828 RepID=A0AAW2DB34_9ROSI